MPDNPTPDKKSLEDKWEEELRKRYWFTAVKKIDNRTKTFKQEKQQRQGQYKNCKMFRNC